MSRHDRRRLVDEVYIPHRPKAKTRGEAGVKLAIQDYLKLTSQVWFRLNAGMFMLANKGGGSRPFRAGVPGMADILVVLPPNGRSLWLEVKRPVGPKGGTKGSEQTTDQILFQRQVEAAGATYAVVRSIADVEAVFAARPPFDSDRFDTPLSHPASPVSAENKKETTNGG